MKPSLQRLWHESRDGSSDGSILTETLCWGICFVAKGGSGGDRWSVAAAWCTCTCVLYIAPATCNQCNQHLLQYWQCGNSGRAGREADGSQGAAVMVSGQHYLSPECHRDTIAAAADLHIPPSLHDGTRPQGTSAQRKLLTQVGVVAGRADRE